MKDLIKLGYKAGTSEEVDIPTVDTDAIIEAVLKRVPKSAGSVVYEVAPLEKIKQDFLQEAKNKILDEVAALSVQSKKILKYLEVQGKSLNTANIAVQALFLTNGSGGNSTTTVKYIKELTDVGLAVKKNNGGTTCGALHDRINFYLDNHGADAKEIDNLYNHIMAEMLK